MEEEICCMLDVFWRRVLFVLGKKLLRDLSQMSFFMDQEIPPSFAGFMVD